MPRINEGFLQCAVFLYKSVQEADAGAPYGGSGFLVGVPSGGPEPLVEETMSDLRPKTYIGGPPPDPWANHPHIYVVTNRHVVDDNPYVRITRRDGKSATIDAGACVKHRSSDLAVTPVRWSREWEHAYKFLLVPHSMFLSEHVLQGLDVGIGDDVFCVGRFVGLPGKRNSPVAKFGSVCVMPTPIDFGKEGVQNVFLVESRINLGYSGSAVFLNLPPWELREHHEQSWRFGLYQNRWPAFAEITVSAPYFTRLLGVASGLMEDYVEPDTGVGRSGMMAVIPAWELLELLNYPELKEQRAQEVEDWKRSGEFNLPKGTPA